VSISSTVPLIDERAISNDEDQKEEKENFILYQLLEMGATFTLSQY